VAADGAACVSSLVGQTFSPPDHPAGQTKGFRHALLLIMNATPSAFKPGQQKRHHRRAAGLQLIAAEIGQAPYG